MGGGSTMWGLLIEGTSFRVHMAGGNVYLLLPVLCSVHICLCMETCMLALPETRHEEKTQLVLFSRHNNLARNQIKYYTAVGHLNIFIA